MTKLVVCHLDELTDPGSKGFELGGVNGILVRKGNDVYAYENRCPHTGATLEWQPDQFLDYEQQFIQCGMHGALFRMEDGYCVRGPCVGDRLTGISTYVQEDGKVTLLQSSHDELAQPVKS